MSEVSGETHIRHQVEPDTSQEGISTRKSKRKYDVLQETWVKSNFGAMSLLRALPEVKLEVKTLDVSG